MHVESSSRGKVARDSGARKWRAIVKLRDVTGEAILGDVNE